MPPNKSGSNAPCSFNGSAHDRRLGATRPSSTTAESGQREPLLSRWCSGTLAKQMPVYTRANIQPHNTYLHTLLLLGTGNYHKWQWIIGYLGARCCGLECNSWWANGDLGRDGREVESLQCISKALPVCFKRCLLPSYPRKLSNSVVCRWSRR